MTFEEIPIRMLQLGISRQWLAGACDYSSSTLASIIAPKGTNRTDKALRRVWEVLDREEERQKAALRAPGPLTNIVTLTPSVAQFDRWMKAAYATHDSFDAWAKEGLDRRAEEELGNASHLRVAEDKPSMTQKKNGG